jgi:putative inorganic carbon (HCO3(-)) transporter
MKPQRLAWILTLAAIAAMPLFVIRYSLFGLPTTLLEVLILAATVITLIAYRRSLRPLPTLAALGALWIIVGLVSALNAPDSWAGLGLWRAYFVEPILLVWCIWQQIDSPRRIRQIIGTLIGVGTIVGLYAIFQWFTGYGIPNPWQEESVRRVTAWLGYPNAVALLLAPVVSMAVGLALCLRTKNKEQRTKTYQFLCWMAGIVMILAVFFARSEGGLIGIGAGLVTVGLLLSKYTRKITLALLVAGVIVVAAVPALRSYAVHTVTLNDCPTLYECSLTLRRTQWADTMTMLKDGRLLYGAGLGGYQEAMLPYHNHPGIEIYLYPHNVFLNFWVELGIAGLILFLVIIAAFWRSVAAALRTPYRAIAVGAAGAMVTLLVHGLVDVPYFKNDLAVLFWLIVLIPMLVHRIDGSKEKT